MTLLTNGIQEHWLKKWVGRKGDYVAKETSFGHIPWEYRSQTMNFLVDPCVFSHTEELWYNETVCL